MSPSPTPSELEAANKTHSTSRFAGLLSKLGVGKASQTPPMDSTPTSQPGLKTRLKHLAHYYSPRAPPPTFKPKDDATLRAEERARYDRQVIDLLDVISPEVSALSTLNDLQNSLFVPDLGRFVDRDRYKRLTDKHGRGIPFDEDDDQRDPESQKQNGILSRFLHHKPTPSHRAQKATDLSTPTPARPGTVAEPDPDFDPTSDGASIVGRGEHMLMPSGLVDDWDQWSDEDKRELDDYVRHMLHSKKWRLRRSLRGFRRYVRTRECCFFVP